MQRRVIVSSLKPATIEHLESAAFADTLHRAAGIKAQPGLGVRGVAAHISLRIQGIVALLLVARLSVLLAGTLFVALIVQSQRTTSLYNNYVAFVTRKVGALRRSNYLYELMLSPGPAKEVRLFRLGSWLVAKYRHAWLGAMDDLWSARRGGWRTIMVSTIPVSLCNAVAFLIIAERGVGESLSAGSVVLYAQAVLASQALGNTSEFDIYIADDAEALRASLDLDQIADASPPRSALRVRIPPSSEAGAPSQSPSVEFVDVRFRYAGQDRDAVGGVNLLIPSGKTLALVGENGAGKTTIAKLLCGLYEPADGSILVDGADLSTIDRSEWHRSIAAAFQDFGHYPFSVRENITLQEINGEYEDAARLAARLAGLDERIASMSHSWDTVLSREYSGGTEISGGEWQRVALARVLYRIACGAALIVMDEPTSQLDARAESSFYESLFSSTVGVTKVIISHRLSTIRVSDCIALLSGGRVVEYGSHEELMERSGGYAHMFRTQALQFGVGC